MGKGSSGFSRCRCRRRSITRLRMQPIADLRRLAWPILRINTKHIQRFDRPAGLLVESEYFLAHGVYAPGTMIIDAKGQEFEVASPRKVRRSYSWKYWGAKHPAWVIALELSPAGSRSLAEVKELLFSKIIERRWHLQGDYAPEDLRAELQGANSFAGLYKKFSFFGNWR